VSELSEKLAPVIHKALLANGVQLTNKELFPVSQEVAQYVAANFDAIAKIVQKKETKVVPVAPPALKPPPPPGGKTA
jgi:hypothetical protein